VSHKSVEIDEDSTDICGELIGEVWVDGGAVGIFDESSIGMPNVGAWQTDMISRTLTKKKASTFKNGCIASSGDGDGMYQVYAQSIKKSVVALDIIF
jgi:hypothetical protein